MLQETAREIVVGAERTRAGPEKNVVELEKDIDENGDEDPEGK